MSSAQDLARPGNPLDVYYYDAETLNNPASPKIGLFCRGSYPESPVPLLFIERTVLKVRQ